MVLVGLGVNYKTKIKNESINKNKKKHILDQLYMLHDKQKSMDVVLKSSFYHNHSYMCSPAKNFSF